MKKKVYWHKKQLEFLRGKQRTKVAMCGRGFGKTAMIPGSLNRKHKSMPRSKHFLSSSTYKQLLTKTLPVMFNKWREYGFKRHYDMQSPGHYVIGVKPPKEWQTPYHKPEGYSNVITFWTGFTIELLSMDIPDLQRGGTYDGGEIDEALLIKKSHYSKVMLPATRGTSVRFKNKDYWKQINFYTSIPWLQSAQWLFEYEERAKAEPDRFMFMEGVSKDNPLITDEDLRQWREEMDYLDYKVEVENMRISKSEKAFYHAWDDEKHIYTPLYLYGEDEEGIQVYGDKSRDKRKRLDISFDFDGWFTCATVFQARWKEERLIDKFFVKEQGVDQLVDKICIKYADQQIKTIHMYGEPRGNDRRPEGMPLFQRIINRFRKHGWNVINKSKKKAAAHEVRHSYVNEILAETNPRLPVLRINKECKDVIISLKMAEILPNFKKSKKLEKDKKFPQEHATHFTDTIDYFFEQKYSKTTSGFSSAAGWASL